MKVLHLATSPFGGAGIAARRLNEALNLNGVTSMLYYSGRNALDLGNLFHVKKSKYTQFKSSLVTTLQKEFIQSQHSPVTPLSINVLKNTDIITDEYDVIHIHATYNFINFKIIEMLIQSQKKIIFTLHDQRLFTGGCHYSFGCDKYKSLCTQCPQVHRFAQKLVKNEHKRLIELFNSNQNIKIIAPSMWIKNIARESAVLKDAQIEVIRNPIPKNFQIEVRSTLRSKMQVKEGEKIITFIAADLSNPNKGLQYLLNAFMRCNVEAVKNCIIFLIGNIDDISVPKNLKYLKFMNRNEKQIEEFMAVTDLLVVPSILDNSPNVVGEALMAGTQVIGSRTGGITEMLEAFHMETFPVGSVDTLTSLIEKMEWNYDRKEIQVNASKMLSYESIAKKYISAYK